MAPDVSHETVQMCFGLLQSQGWKCITSTLISKTVHATPAFRCHWCARAQTLWVWTPKGQKTIRTRTSRCPGLLKRGAAIRDVISGDSECVDQVLYKVMIEHVMLWGWSNTTSRAHLCPQSWQAYWGRSSGRERRAQVGGGLTPGGKWTAPPTHLLMERIRVSVIVSMIKLSMICDRICREENEFV